MKKKKELEAKEKKQYNINRKWVILSLVLTILIISVSLFLFFFQTNAIEFSFKAAIVDQLGGSFPNKNFIGNVTEILQQYNFTVVHNRSAEITVNFYKSLPKSNPGVVIFRVHSAIRNNTQLVDFFTSEKYKPDEYAEYGDCLSKAWLSWKSNYYFAIGPGFVEIMDGDFPKSVVIAMGCDSLKYSTMAEAFIDKGAKLYIGWTGLVSVADSDEATIKLLELLFIQNKTIEYAISHCNSYLDDKLPPPEFEGRLAYFPKDVGDKKVWDIVLNSDFQTSSLLDFDKLGFITLTFLVKEGISIRKCCLPFHNVWRRCCKDVL